MSLYEISTTYKDLLEAIESGEIPEEAIADTLAGIDGEFTDKADNIASFIKSLLADAQGIGEEMDSLAERKKAKINKAERLTDYLYQQFKLTGKQKIETSRNVMSIRKTPQKVVIDDEFEFLAWAQEFEEKTGDDRFLNYKDPSINKTAVKEFLKANNTIPHAKLVSGEKLAIK